MRTREVEVGINYVKVDWFEALKEYGWAVWREPSGVYAVQKDHHQADPGSDLPPSANKNALKKVIRLRIQERDRLFSQLDIPPPVSTFVSHP